MAIKLQWTDEAGTHVKTLEGPVKIGAGSVAHIRVRAAKVSDLHAVITIEGDTIQLTDMGSEHGTSVNGKKVRTAQLKHHDVLKIGKATLTLRIE